VDIGRLRFFGAAPCLPRDDAEGWQKAAGSSSAGHFPAGSSWPRASGESHALEQGALFQLFQLFQLWRIRPGASRLSLSF
jgi:hypothetical protein